MPFSYFPASKKECLFCPNLWRMSLRRNMPVLYIFALYLSLLSLETLLRPNSFKKLSEIIEACAN